MIQSQSVHSELVQRLSTGVEGVDTTQASAAAGLIFKLLKARLDDQDFATLDTVIPESDELAAAAPRIEQGQPLSGIFGGLNQAVGGSQLAELGNLASLASGFGHIGLAPDKVQPIVGLILDYVREQGGEQIHRLIAKALRC